MNYGKTFLISSVGMNIEKTRMEVSAKNLAYAHTPLDKTGQGYRAMQVVVSPSNSFEQHLGMLGSAEKYGENTLIQIVPSLSPVRTQFEPAHPMADKDGNVSYPAVDAAQEMMTMMSAMRAYEANVAAMNIAKTMALKSLEIGGGN